ncbi:MAG TPA: hypothetical protein VGJ97_01105 [Anaerolineaceae bacterium]|jgi:hypothetical protein
MSSLDERIEAQAAHGPAVLGRSRTVNQLRVLAPGQKLPASSAFRRVLVLVPNTDGFQDSQLSQRIWQLASSGRASVVYLTIAEDYQTEMSARRRLTLLAAITRDKHVLVETQVLHTSHWADAVQSILQPGDVLLVQAEQRVPKRLFGSQPLSDGIGKRVVLPIYLLSGYFQESPVKPSQALRLTFSALVLGLILAGFFALDKQVIEQLNGAIQMVMLLILLVLEVGAIWIWNGWTG